MCYFLCRFQMPLVENCIQSPSDHSKPSPPRRLYVSYFFIQTFHAYTNWRQFFLYIFLFFKFIVFCIVCGSFWVNWFFFVYIFFMVILYIFLNVFFLGCWFSVCVRKNATICQECLRMIAFLYAGYRGGAMDIIIISQCLELMENHWEHFVYM